MVDIKQFLVKLGILKESGAPRQQTPQASQQQAKGQTGQPKVNFGIALKNFQNDLPHIGEHLQQIANYSQDRQIAFGLMCCGLILIIVGLVVQFVL